MCVLRSDVQQLGYLLELFLGWAIPREETVVYQEDFSHISYLVSNFIV